MDDKSDRDDGNIIEEYPTSDPRTFGKTVAHLSLGLADIYFPGLGYLLQSGADRIAPDPLQKRREDWLRSVGQAINSLAKKYEDFDIESLSENEQFLSTVLEATEIAMRTHREEKREALKSAVVNSASGVTLEEALHGRFMSYLESLSSTHIRVLRVLDNPKSFEACVEKTKRMMMGGLADMIRAEIPESEVSETLLNVVVRDLNGDGLVEISSMGTTLSSTGMMESRTTAAGRAFLQFITSAE